ncbi:MAG: alkaline phosphatase family protein [Candidatus Heimdallarchaeota archaeon]
MAKKGPKVILWILDGCNVDAFLQVAQTNPNLKTLYEGGYYTKCVTTFPSTTPAAHAAILTGCYPTETRVPAFDWVNVEKLRWYERCFDLIFKKNDSWGETRNYIRSSPEIKYYRDENLGNQIKHLQNFIADLEDALKLNTEYLNSKVATIFETLKDKYTVSVKEWIHRGADDFFRVTLKVVLVELISEQIIDRETIHAELEELVSEQIIDRETIQTVLETSVGVDAFIQAVLDELVSARKRKLPDLMVYWEYSTDLISHIHGPGSTELRNSIDKSINKLVATLKFYEKQNVQPYVMIIADHSHSYVNEFSTLIQDFKKAMRNQGYQVAGREDRSNRKRITQADIIVANNERAVLFYAFNGKTSKQATKKAIIDFLKSRSKTDVDLILYKNNKGQILVIQPPNTLPMNIAQFIQAGNNTNDFPCAKERIQGLLNGDNWGDVVISLKEGYSLHPSLNPEASSNEPIQGDHGGLNKNDSIVPFLIWGPTIKSNAKDADSSLSSIRIVDITPTIAGIFGEKHKPKDGHVLDKVFK